MVSHAKIMNMKRVAVIGAGAGGLCCARHLSRFPETFQFTVYEQSDQVGGTWVYSNPSPHSSPVDVRTVDSHGPHSSTYKNLRTNLPKEMMLFPDFPIYDESLPSFPTHREIHTYFKKYCEHFQLEKYIEFGQLVEQVTPLPLSSSAATDSLDTVQWRVVTKSRSGERKSEMFDFVFGCSGHFFYPFIPDIKGLSSFPRLVAHSHWYREPEPFAGQAILVVGTGPSGEDLIIDLSSHARAIYLSSRKGPIKSRVPDNVEQLPGVSEFREDGRVCFENGEERSIDCVILATGYLYSYPFLTEESGIKVVGGKRVTHLYKHTFNVAHPSMAFIGVYFAVVPLPGFDLQVQWILRVWRGEKSLPLKQEMLEDVEKTYQRRLDEGLPPQLAGHYLEEIQWDLFREFAEGGGVKPLDNVIQQLYETASHGRENDLFEYRNKEYEIVNENTYQLVERKQV